MSIKLEEVIKDLKLTEDQEKMIGSIQENFDSIFSSEIENEKKGLVTKNSDLINRLKEAKEKADKAEGMDIDGYNNYLENKDKLEAERVKAEQDALAAAGEWDKLKGDMTTNHEKTISTITETKDQEISNLRHTLDTMLIENVSLKEIEKVEGSQVLLMPHIKNSITTYQDDNGNYAIKVIDANGKDRMNTETGNPLKVSELVAEFQANKEFAGAFPIQNSGSNSNVNTNTGNHNGTNNPFDKKGGHFSLTEQAKLIKTNPTLAKTLKDAVG